MPDFEVTDVGIQTLIEGVKPVSLGETLTAMTLHPMQSGRTLGRKPFVLQKPCDIGLFDEVGRAQIDLIDLIAELETSHET